MGKGTGIRKIKRKKPFLSCFVLWNYSSRNGGQKSLTSFTIGRG